MTGTILIYNFFFEVSLITFIATFFVVKFDITLAPPPPKKKSIIRNVFFYKKKNYDIKN